MHPDTAYCALSWLVLLHDRYLILTYAAEYDRVHYPLPLAYVESPEREQLERTIDRLREVRVEGWELETRPKFIFFANPKPPMGACQASG